MSSFEAVTAIPAAPKLHLRLQCVSDDATLGASFYPRLMAQAGRIVSARELVEILVSAIYESRLDHVIDDRWPMDAWIDALTDDVTVATAAKAILAELPPESTPDLVS